MVRDIKNISIREIKKAKKIISALELLGITEEDLLKIKGIPQMEEELEELRAFKKEVIANMRNETSGGTESKRRSISEQVRDAYNSKVEEFNPYGKRKPNN